MIVTANICISRVVGCITLNSLKPVLIKRHLLLPSNSVLFFDKVEDGGRLTLSATVLRGKGRPLFGNQVATGRVSCPARSKVEDERK
uniref:4HBT domain-containing protein n=1 Tax=Panagrellus redivivus TaxID=6233 RepID=A0A7E4UZS8_PANRE